MKKKCELCKSVATMYCDSDQAILCWDCDARVHTANFLVAKHTRTLLCHLCQSLTPWTASGPKFGSILSVCNSCASAGGQCDLENGDGEDDGQDGDGLDDDRDRGSDDDNDDGGDDEGDNQVVPLVPSSLPPPSALSSSSSEESSGGSYRGRDGVSNSG